MIVDAPNHETVDRFVNLFRGRADIYGSAKGFCVHEPLTRAVFERHLTSTDPNDWIGVYCMLGELCSWGCIDIDGKDFPMWEAGDDYPKVEGHDWDKMWQLALDLRTVLAYKNIHGHIERTKNGYHVWVFPDDPLVKAATMRRALMAACVAIGYNPNEVNPKAEGPRPGTKGYGNFVRLPYGGSLTSPGRKDRIFVEHLDDTWIEYEVEAALDILEYFPNPTSNLEAVAALWTPPPPKHCDYEVDYDAGLDATACVRLLDGVAYTIWKDGPLPGSDRSSTLVRLAHIAREHGLTATQTYTVVRSADSRWGKFQDRPEMIADIIEKVYA